MPNNHICYSHTETEVDNSARVSQNTDMDIRLFNKREVCQMLNIGLSSLNKLLRLGCIKPAPIKAVKRTLFTYASIKDYIDSLNKENWQSDR